MLNVDWHGISSCQKLSESFIEKHSDKVKWNVISQYQKLSESFIEKYSGRDENEKYKINWEKILKHN